MKVRCKCPQCDQVNKISALIAADRIELARKKGAEFDLRCISCGANVKIHVDDVYAESDKTVLYAGIAGVIICVILTLWLWKTGFILTSGFTKFALIANVSKVAVIFLAIPFLLVASVSKYERTKIKMFNYGYYDSKRLSK